MKDRIRSFYLYTLLVLAMIIWGCSFVITKSLFNDFSPISIIFIRLLIASCVLLIISRIFYKKYFKIKKKDIGIIFLLSFFEPFLYFLFETYSLQITPATIVAILVATIPLFTSLVSKFYFKEQLSGLNFIGIIVSIIGIFIMLYPDFSNTSFNFLGILLAIGAVLSAVGYGICLKKISNLYHPVIIITWQNVTAMLLLVPLIFILNPREILYNEAHALFKFSNFVSLSLLAVFGSSLAFIFYLESMRYFGLGKANSFTNLIPVITAIFSFFILKEAFSFFKIIGIIIVIFGIFLVQNKKKNKSTTLLH